MFETRNNDEEETEKGVIRFEFDVVVCQMGN